MATRVKIRSKTGTTRSAGAIQVPANTQDLAAAVEQLQETVNKLIAGFNAHQHAAFNAAPSTGLIAGNATVADVALFTTAPTS